MQTFYSVEFRRVWHCCVKYTHEASGWMRYGCTLREVYRLLANASCRESVSSNDGDKEEQEKAKTARGNMHKIQ